MAQKRGEVKLSKWKTSLKTEVNLAFSFVIYIFVNF